MGDANNDIKKMFNSVLWNATRRMTTARPRALVPVEIIDRADALLRAGDYSAVRTLMEGQEGLKEDTTALQAFALALIGLEEPDQASELLLQVIERLRKQISGAYANLSLALFDKGSRQEALAAAHHSRECKPDFWIGWINSMMVHCAKQDRQGLEEEIKAMKEAWPGWQQDRDLEERIKMDVTLRFLREEKSLRQHFNSWLK